MGRFYFSWHVQNLPYSVFMSSVLIKKNRPISMDKGKKEREGMSELTIALITIFGTVASVSGVEVYVFNGTRKLIREIHTTMKEMHKEAEQRHREIMDWFKRNDERSEQQHTEVIELLKKGFGDMSRDIGEIKGLVKQ